MKKNDGPTNGKDESSRSAFITQVIDENPYLQSRPDEHEGDQPRQENQIFDEIIEDEDGAPVEPEDELRRVQRRRRRLALTAIATLLLLALVFAIALYRRTPTRVDYGRTKQGEVLPPAPNSNANSSRDSRTDKAIEEARRLTDRQTPTDEASAIKSDVTTAAPNSKAILETPFKFPSDSDAGVNTTAQVNETATSAGAANTENKSESTGTTPSENYPRGIRSQRSSETSLYTNEPLTDRVINPSKEAKESDQKKTFSTAERNKQITLPTFASMLPVRTIGALYTLRTGALVRFELTRETRGDGWSLKRGTILVGSTKGGDLNRAYVSLIGFIDPQSGKLVKLGGDLLGGDGAAGLKGKRRQLDGGWGRVFGRLASSALDVTGALLSGRGRDTVIISDGLRAKTVNPVTDEISGVLGGDLDRRRGRSFVEVSAGTPGYVLVTDLPSVIDGKEPIPEVNSDTLASLTNVDDVRPATGLSERELADLLANGSSDQIRAAMPRMSPEMRKIAEAVLRP